MKQISDNVFKMEIDDTLQVKCPNCGAKNLRENVFPVVEKKPEWYRMTINDDNHFTAFCCEKCALEYCNKHKKSINFDINIQISLVEAHKLCQNNGHLYSEQKTKDIITALINNTIIENVFFNAEPRRFKL